MQLLLLLLLLAPLRLGAGDCAAGAALAGAAVAGSSIDDPAVVGAAGGACSAGGVRGAGGPDSMTRSASGGGELGPAKSRKKNTNSGCGWPQAPLPKRNKPKVCTCF